jgi:hypothetical protein
VFFYNPILCVAMLGWRAFRNSWRAESMAIAAVLLTGLGTYAKFCSWGGDASWGPRFLLTLLPLAIVPLTWVSWPGRCAARLGFASVIGVSVFVQLLGVFVPIATDYSYQDDPRVAAVEQQLMIACDDDVLIHYMPSFSPIGLHVREWKGWQTSLRWSPYDASSARRSYTVVGALLLGLLVVSIGMLVREMRREDRRLKLRSSHVRQPMIL